MVIKFIVQARRYYSRLYGTGYHSVRITRCRDGFTIYSRPVMNGGGDMYRQTALRMMADVKWLPVKYRKNWDCMMYERENNYPIQWSVSDGTEREMRQNVPS